jgi:Recombinase zinc beta ribbon domain
MRRMDANRARAESMGAVRDGPALLAGLVVCGRCGKRMTVRYQRGSGGRLHPSYVCSRDSTEYAAARCQQLAGGCVDAHVTGLLLEAMAPAALEASLAAAEQIEQRRAEVDRIWRQRLERADYAADRARRQYQLAEPENRLVVRQLERDWEAALAQRQRLGEDYDRHLATRPRTLTQAEREQIRALAADIPTIWHAPTTTDADRKQLIRHLVDQVRVEVIGTSERVRVRITWAGGHHTDAEVVRPVACLTQLSYYPRLVARARELATTKATTAQIAQRLNAEGLRPPKRCQTFTTNAVNDLLRTLGIQRSHTPARRPRPALAEHEWWLRDLAEHLHMPEATLDAWVRRGWATGYLHPEARLRVVRADPTEVQRLRTLHQIPRGGHTRRPWLNNQAATINTDHEEGTHSNADKPQI